MFVCSDCAQMSETVVSFPSGALAALRATISTDAFVPGKVL